MNRLPICGLCDAEIRIELGNVVCDCDPTPYEPEQPGQPEDGRDEHDDTL